MDIINFYSIKGGTGRSIALVNVAYKLAQKGKKVMCVDFDLYAPSLYVLFEKFLLDNKMEFTVRDKTSLIDVLLFPATVRIRPFSINTFGEGGIYVLPIYKLNREVLDKMSKAKEKILSAHNLRAVSERLIQYSIVKKIDYLLIDSKSGISNEAVAVLLYFIKLQKKIQGNRRIFLLTRLDPQSLDATRNAVNILFDEFGNSYDDLPVEIVFSNVPRGEKVIELASGSFYVSTKASGRIKEFTIKIKEVNEDIISSAVIPYDEDFSINPQIIDKDDKYGDLQRSYDVLVDHILKE